MGLLMRQIVEDPIPDSTVRYELRFAVTRFIERLQAAREHESDRWLLESRLPQALREVWHGQH